jgi:hypothetical protein
MLLKVALSAITLTPRTTGEIISSMYLYLWIE